MSSLPMRHRRLAVLVLLLLLSACSRKRGAVATLIQLDGTVESQRKTDDAPWQVAATGERYQIGDAVRTATDATARLRLARKGTVDLDPETVVRFRKSAGDHLDLGVEAGAVELEAGELELVLDTEAGAAHIKGGGRARVSAIDGETRLEVLVGSVILEGADGDRELTAGSSIEIAMGGAILEDDPITKPAPVDAGVAPADAATGPAPGPALVDVVIKAGETATIHDPSPPTAVAVKVDCPEGGQLEIVNKKGATVTTAVDGIASAQLAPGTRKYRVTCGGKVIDDGKLVIDKDAARKQLPSRPPKNVVDADGRKYTVLYQNRLPELVLRWMDAPPADSFVAHLVSGKKDKTLPAKKARFELDSGALREGTHKFWIQGGGKKSPETTIEIAFDNAAAAIYVKRVAVNGADVVVEGAAIRDTTVSIEGNSVSLDDQLRFVAKTSVGAGRRAAALRIAHRSGGVHYYVLRGEDAP